MALFDDFDPIQPIRSNQYGISTKKITSGSLITFNYPKSMAKKPNIIHDHYPMVIVSTIWDKYLAGVNLHYLTFPYIKRVLGIGGNNNSFKWDHVKPDLYIARSYRLYVREGMFQVKKLDTDFLLQVMSSVRSFSPSEVEKVRHEIEAQIHARLQPSIDELQDYERQRQFQLWRQNVQKSANLRAQLQRRVGTLEQGVLRGPSEGLIYPAEAGGPRPATHLPKPGEGGSFSTEEGV